MGASSSNERIALIWIDKNVDNEENTNYQNELNKHNQIKLFPIKNVDLGIKFFKKLSFKRVIILISGSLFQEFYQKFRENLPDLAIVPKIIIFTSSVSKMKNNFGGILPLYHPFYNSHGIICKFQELEDILLFKISFKDYIIPSQYNRLERIRDDEKFFFEYIRNKYELVLPLFFSSYTNIPSDEQIQTFNKLILTNFGKIPEISNLFSQINEVKDIPMEILSKYWIKAYTAETDFYRKMNERLMQNKNKEFITYIQVLYEGVKSKALKPKNDFANLYRGGIISQREYKIIVDYYTKRNPGLPGVIVYSRSFVSFTDDKNIAIKFKEQKKNQIKNDQMFGLFIIENSINENFCNSCAYIKDCSFFPDESETLFFPYSCFEIVEAKNIGKYEFIIKLNYLGKYTNLFNGQDPKNFLEFIPNDSNFAKDIFSAKILKSNVKPPKWWISLQQKNNININNKIQIQNSNPYNQNKISQISYNQNIKINQNKIINNIPYHKSQLHNIEIPKQYNKMKILENKNNIFIKKLEHLNLKEDELEENLDDIINFPDLNDDNDIEENNMDYSNPDQLINQILQQNGMKLSEEFEGPQAFGESLESYNEDKKNTNYNS